MQEKTTNRIFKWATILIFAVSLAILIALAKSFLDIAIPLIIWIFIFGLALLMLFMAAHPHPGIFTVKYNPEDKHQTKLIRQMTGAIAIVIAFIELFLILAWHITNDIFTIVSIIVEVLALFAVILMFSWRIKKLREKSDDGQDNRC